MDIELTVLNTGSSGNGYIFKQGDNTIILECGVPVKEVIMALKGDISTIKAVLLTHRHIDHAAYTAQYSKYRLNIISSYDRTVRINDYIIKPLRVPHGDCECHAYVIKSPDGQNTLFATDMSNFPYHIAGLNHMIIECNHDVGVIASNAAKGIPVFSSYVTHMNLDKTIEAIKRHLPLKTVTLIHLSNNNADEKLFRDRIWEECGVRVNIAKKKAKFILKDSDF